MLYWSVRDDRYRVAVFTRPDDLTDDDVVGALADGWAVAVRDIEYAAVGFGSHHWRVTGGTERWFATVDDLDARPRHMTDTRRDAANRLSAALNVARSLHDDGLQFVVAPIPTLAGDVVHRIHHRYVVALYPHVDGEAHPWGPYPTRDDRLAVLERIVAVHAADKSTVEMALLDDFSIPSRDRLVEAVSDSSTPWGPGPYAADAQDLLQRHSDFVGRLLSRYDELVDNVASRQSRLVLTHGEPHRGNTINTANGVVLIDWDTALLAPPERDLWALIGEDPVIAEEYTARTGVGLDDSTIQMYRLWWNLCDTSLFVNDLRQPHQDTDDTRIAWRKLNDYLDPQLPSG
jgi:Phosphotransferase enzyme family